MISYHIKGRSKYFSSI